MTKVTVYRFTIYDITTDENRISKRMGTLEGIERVCGTPIEGTAVEIDASELDPEIVGLTPRDWRPRRDGDGFPRQVRV
jgi:hypothetical protein